MDNLELINIFYRQNKDVPEYMDIFFETNMGNLECNVASIRFLEPSIPEDVNRVVEIDDLKSKYGKLDITEARNTYDNNKYILISDKFILGIEYTLNSNYSNSIQEFRIIEDIL